MFAFLLQMALLVRVEAAVDIGEDVASEGEAIDSRYKSPKPRLLFIYHLLITSFNYFFQETPHSIFHMANFNTNSPNFLFPCTVFSSPKATLIHPIEKGKSLF